MPKKKVKKVQRRNPLAVVVRFRSGAGAHKKSNKAKRKQSSQDMDWSDE